MPGIPQGICIPPVCWQFTYNFGAATDIVIKPNKVPAWWKGIRMPLGSHPALEAALIAGLNAGANLFCDHDCVCMRLNRNAVVIALPPQRMGPAPGGVFDVYMDGITMTCWWGLCLAKKWVKVKKGNQWIPVEDLPSTDILTPPSSPGGGHKKKKGKKGTKGKARRRR